MPSYAAGAMRDLVVLEQRKQQADAGFALLNTYDVIGEAYAQIEGVGGAAYQAGVQIEERITHRMTIRWRKRTDFNHVRIRVSGQRFRLRRLRDPDGMRRRLVLEVEELAPGNDAP